MAPSLTDHEPEMTWLPPPLHHDGMETMRVAHLVRIDDLPEDTHWPRHEILEGALVVTPYAGLAHQSAVGRVLQALAAAAPAGVVVYPGANLRRIEGGTESLLAPDVVVARADTADPTYLSPREVLLAVEVVSPGSRTMDLVTKRATYAAWGVPAYLVADPVVHGGDGGVLRAGALAATWHGDTSSVAWAVAAVAAVAAATA